VSTQIPIGLPLEFFQLRVLLWKDPHDIYVGQCLETGSVGTADDVDTLRDIMTELLTDEVDFNLATGNLGNLFNTPAPLEVWKRYHELSKNRNADVIAGILMLDATV